MNKKGFTLFTALISLLLVSVALVLIFNMINTEDTYLSLIQDQSSMSDLMTIADITRADAFNTFIITLRSSWEQYMSRHPMQVTRDQMDMNWDDFTQWFIKDNFFEKAFPAYFAQGILFNLKYNMQPPGYDIRTETNTGTKIVCEGGCDYGDLGCNCHIETTDTSGDTRNLFIDVIVEVFKAGGEKADVIDCDTGDENCNGSFFLTLNTTQLDDEEYEMLPIVTVLRTRSSQVIQRPVLSRQIYKIYIPWRGLQALRTARNLVLDNATEKHMYPANPESENTGFFSPKIHNTLEQARLGFCDPGTCHPRNYFFQTPDKTGANAKCHEIPKNIYGDVPGNLLPISNVTLQTDFKYDSERNLKTAFTELYKQSFLNNLAERHGDTISYNNGLVMKGNIKLRELSPIAPDVNISEIDVKVDSKRSKTYITQPPADFRDYTHKNQKFNTIQDIKTVVGGLGLFLKDNKSYRIWQVNNQWYKDQNSLVVLDNDSQSGTSLQCSEISYATTTLQFMETDPRYKIKEEYIDVNTNIRIQIIENFSEFYFPPGGSWSDLYLFNNTSYLDPESVVSLGNADIKKTDSGIQPWVCYSQVQPNTDGICSPEKG